jgi:hypothetical protein
VSKLDNGVSGCASCGSLGPVGGRTSPASVVAGAVAVAGVAGVCVEGAGSGAIASSGAFRSPLNRGNALSNSASGTIGASERGSFDCG